MTILVMVAVALIAALATFLLLGPRTDVFAQNTTGKAQATTPFVRHIANPPTFTYAGKVKVPAQAKFHLNADFWAKRFSRGFKMAVSIEDNLRVSNNRMEYFYDLVELPTPAATLKVSYVSGRTHDEDLRGQFKVKPVTLGQFFYLHTLQPNGEKGLLRTQHDKDCRFFEDIACVNIVHYTLADGTVAMFRSLWMRGEGGWSFTFGGLCDQYRNSGCDRHGSAVVHP